MRSQLYRLAEVAEHPKTTIQVIRSGGAHAGPLAEMTGVDLQDEIEAKMAKNAARIYQRLPNGVLAKSNSDAD